MLNSTDASEVADIDWDNIGFGLKPTDYMYVMKCNLGGEFSNGELQRFGNIEVSPSAGVLNYGQVYVSQFLKVLSFTVTSFIERAQSLVVEKPFMRIWSMSDS